MTTKDPINDDSPLFSLPSSSEPPRHLLRNDDPTPFHSERSFHHATWAKTFHSFPALVVRPTSPEEVQKTILLAKQARRRLVVVGIKHSPSDLTCTSSWMVDLTRMNKVLTVQRYGTQGRARVLVQAGISLEDLNEHLAKLDLTLPTLGSITVQTLSGAISTGTHGSSLRHGLLSSYVRGLRIVTADGCTHWCSSQTKPDLFRASLISLGALGIITEIEYDVVPDRRLEWHSELLSMDHFLDIYRRKLWTQAEFVRCYWLPYLDRVLVWTGDETSLPDRPPPASYYGGSLGYYTYRSLLWLAHYIPRILPTVEWFVFGMQNRFSPGPVASAIEPQRTALKLDCLFSQFVNEWALPLSKGPEAINRLRAWFRHDDRAADIPIPSRGIYVHAPIEVRVTDGTARTTHTRAFLDPTSPSEPTLYLNAILYRTASFPPPGMHEYYAAFEHVMRDVGARPHWAKNFETVAAPEIQDMYGKDLSSFLATRQAADPEGQFIGPWHRRNLFGESEKRLPLEEIESHRTAHAAEGGEEVYSTQSVARNLDDTVVLGQVTPSLRSEGSFEVPSSAGTEGSAEEILLSESVVREGMSTVLVDRD